MSRCWWKHCFHFVREVRRHKPGCNKTFYAYGIHKCCRCPKTVEYLKRYTLSNCPVEYSDDGTEAGERSDSRLG